LLTSLEQTPGGHEGGDGDGSVVVKDMREPGEVTAVTEVAVVTETITHRACDELRASRVANVVPVIMIHDMIRYAGI